MTKKIRDCFPVFEEQDRDLALLKWRFDRHGYPRTTFNVRINGRKRAINRFAHQLVAARMLGRDLLSVEIPDHIDFNKLNNKRENLRIGSKQQNSQHRQPFGKSGIRGVCWNKSARKWQAQVGHNRKTYYCGIYSSPEEAGEAAAEKRRELNFQGEPK